MEADGNEGDCPPGGLAGGRGGVASRKLWLSS